VVAAKVSDWLLREAPLRNLPDFLREAANFGQKRFGYTVTPNVDDLVRCYENAGFQEHYRAADHVLLDSRFAAAALRVMKGARLSVCSRKTMTTELLGQVAARSDRIVIVGTGEEATAMASHYGLAGVTHHDASHTVYDDTDIDSCVRFIESQSPFRFCFLTCGSPQQEAIAALLRERDIARGLTLCVGPNFGFRSISEMRRKPFVHAGSYATLASAATIPYLNVVRLLDCNQLPPDCSDLKNSKER
jgi:UDP-N-acetyl-D-mannosaminuronic acid transferase (WecB/TagA/CpsF family)